MNTIKQQRFLFVYLCGFSDSENKIIKLKHVSSLKYAFHEFEEKIFEIRDEMQEVIESDGVLELFCILGDPLHIEKVDILFKKSIKKLFDQICEGNFKAYDKLLASKGVNHNLMLDKLLDIYLQHLVSEDYIRYPIDMRIETEDLAAQCYYSNKNYEVNRREFAESMFRIWYQNEKPTVFGKQILTQEFMLDDLKGRRIISNLTDRETGESFLLLEGGLKLYLREEFPYIREKIDQVNLNFFAPGNIETIITNPVYAFNKYFMPYEIFEDWQKVLNYVLAITKIKWKDHEISKIYQKFMSFMEQNICEVQPVHYENIISKSQFYACYMRQIEQIRGYFSGNEEAVLSKDYIFLLRSRYVFLPSIYELLKQTFPSLILFKKEKVFNLKEYNHLLERLNSENSYDKGKSLEDVAEYLVETSRHLQVMGKRIRTQREEIDISCCNISLNSNVWKFGSFILIECKNWKDKVGIDIIRELSYIMFYKGNIVTILFASNGVTKQSKSEIKKLAMLGKYILCIDKTEFKTFQNEDDFVHRLITKYQTLESSIENSFNLIGG